MMYRILPLLSLGLLVGLGACTGDDKSTTDDSSGGGDDSSGGGDDSGAVEGITISGSASNLLTGAPATEGLCVVAADPTAAVAGGELTVLATSTVNADGTFSVSGVANTSAVGLLVIVEDCEGEGPTVLPTATGIKKDDYYDLAAGATLSDRSIYSIDATSQAAFQAGLTVAGYTGDLATDGALVGFVLDSGGTAIADATVAGPSTATTYYMAADGSFNTSGTSASVNSLFVIPKAPVFTYAASASGYTFDSVLAGSQPGYAVLIRFIAD